MPPDVVGRAHDDDAATAGIAWAVVVDTVADIAAAVVAAARAGVPAAFDSTRLAAADALAAEAVAVTDGCRLLRTGDVRRSRRVAEVLGAVLGARRAVDDTTGAASTAVGRSARG